MRHRLVRWVGDPYPYEDPVFQRAVTFGQAPPRLVIALDFYNKWQRQRVIEGASARCFGVTDGFSRHYCFGPDQYLAWMEPEDADLLFANEWERWQFLDVTEEPWRRERPRMSRNDWQRLLASFGKMGRGRRLRPEYRSGREATGTMVAAARRR